MRKSETGDVVTEQRDRVWLKKNVAAAVKYYQAHK